MTKVAKFVDEIIIKDPETKLDVNIAIYRHPNGGMFGIDASYLDQSFEDGFDPIIPDPLMEVYCKEDCHVTLMD